MLCEGPIKLGVNVDHQSSYFMILDVNFNFCYIPFQIGEFQAQTPLFPSGRRILQYAKYALRVEVE